jgi:hypothetical protein
MGPFEAATAWYYELRGRLATGQLSAAEFQAAVDGLLLRQAGRYWRLAPGTGRWQVYAGGRWLDWDPSAGPPRSERLSTSSLLRPLLVAGAAAIVLAGLVWWDPPRLPVASTVVAEAPPLPNRAPTMPASLPEVGAGGAVVERAFQLLAGRTPTAADLEALTPVLSWEARLRPWAIQFVRWPEQEHLRLVDYDPPSVEPISPPVLRAQAVGVYQSEDGQQVRVRWAFTLVPEDDQWRIRSIALAGLESGGV